MYATQKKIKNINDTVKKDSIKDNVKAQKNTLPVTDILKPVESHTLQLAQDKYIPQKDRYPHLHIFDGGVVYSTGPDSHKYLMKKNRINKGKVQTILDTLSQGNINGAQEMLNYINANLI